MLESRGFQALVCIRKKLFRTGTQTDVCTNVGEETAWSEGNCFVNLLLTLMTRSLNVLYKMKHWQKILSLLDFRNSVVKEEIQQGDDMNKVQQLSSASYLN